MRPPVDGVLGAVGDTPLVRLTRLSAELGLTAYAKLERFNPGGSVKDRTAVSMLRAALRDGDLVPGRSTVVESSSGNLAVGLAQFCLYHRLDFVCVVDAKTTAANLRLLRALGATVEVITEPDQLTGEFLPARLRRVRELNATLPGSFWPNQYANPLNARAHHETMHEIAQALDGRVDYVLFPTGSCGTLVGCARYVRVNGLDTRIVAVDAVGSVLFGLPPGPRLIPGHGASVRPPLLDDTLADDVVHVTDLDCVVACRRLARSEAILAGGSSGAAVAGLHRLATRIPPGSHCVMIFPDGGDRYLDTVYSDAWVEHHFGDVSGLWRDREPAGQVSPC
ncbi:2,3-diaminopropionate biosynthesis protein SbnA [Kineosporia sp. J2-2]|uniref:N-(2-amino-2-carboxyethyl)-L-glutamate synthase n=1 Tax=Kineosporia corallincola TaxID=2835133 RepID=A0ABS5TGB2_9ACTN|nr:2,3-diaminopropionate biosynthesis protein SbnA [Kineosporia corallincola]MBT0770102.1 2,3-diaminopropionate biosynthesis protein SbnA [Kineosporia corallincola]